MQGAWAGPIISLVARVGLGTAIPSGAPGPIASWTRCTGVPAQLRRDATREMKFKWITQG